MLNVCLSHNFFSFIIFEFVCFVVCTSLFDFAIKLIFSEDFKLLHHQHNNSLIFQSEKSDSHVTTVVIHKNKKINKSV